MSSAFKPMSDARPKLARNCGRDKLLYLDAPSGVAGDMLVAALLDLGVPEDELRAGLSGLGLSGHRIGVETVERSGIAAKRFVVDVEQAQPSRAYAAIVASIERATSLSEGARRRALATFALLGEAEARVHGVPIDRVHFHEVGAVDSIVDIVAAAIALDYLGARVVCSPLPMGRGMTKSQHGPIPLPAPATLFCLRNAPTYDAGIEEELVTPTGAALVATASEAFGGWPKVAPEAIGFGAGTKIFADRPNVLRVVLGTPFDASFGTHHKTAQHVIVETNVDDMSGELASFVLARVLSAGALDTWAVPITMKKGRPAMTLCALCEAPRAAEIAAVLLGESTSFGVRTYAVDRIERSRRHVEVPTEYGAISVKVADGDGLPETISPEYEACREAAERHGVPLRHVYAAALAAYRAQR